MHQSLYLLETEPTGNSDTEGWVSPRPGLDAFERRKIFCTCQESNHDSLAIQPVAQSLYSLTLLAILAEVAVGGK
jgi:hypothetical protein